MPGAKHKPRKRYIPKRADLDPIGLAFSRAALLTLEQRQNLLTVMHRAFKLFRAGQGDADTWRELADAMNVGEQLVRLNIAADHADTFQAAQNALHDVHHRAVERGSYTLYPREITALDDAVFVHSIQLEHCSQGELATAIETVQRRVRQALAGNGPADARMCVPGALGISQASAT